jgi:hypothetical protein
MTIKSRIEKLERRQAGGCDLCLPQIQFYTVGADVDDPPSIGETCPKCNRNRGISQIIIHIPDNGRGDRDARV